jgi:hypothetical protein
MPNITPNVNTQHQANPDAQSLANFIDTAHANGYGNIDPSATVTVAQSAGNNAGAQSYLDIFKQGLSSAWQSVGHFFGEPSVKQPPTIAQQMNDHFKNTGVPSIPGETISDIQNQMIKAGYGKNLKADGVWTADWNNQSYQMHLDTQNQPAAGTTSARNVFGAIFTPMLFSHAIPLVLSMGKSVVGDVLKGLAVPGKLMIKEESAVNKLEGGTGDSSQLAANIPHAFDSAGRLIENQKTQTLDQYIATPLGKQDLLNVASAALTASTLGKLGEESYLAVKGATAAGKAAGAKTTVGSLFTDLGADSAFQQGKAGKWVMNSILPETENGMRRFAFTKSLQNMPTLNFMNNVNKVATGIADGWKANRTLLATPYRLPIIGALGKTGVATATAGLKLGLIGHADNFLGDPNAGAAQALDHLQPIAGIEGNALNLLQVGLHAPTYDVAGAPSAVIGQKVENARQKLVDGLNQNQVIANWERGTGSSYKDIVAQAASRGVPQSAVDASIFNNLNRMSAAHAAQSLWEAKVANNAIDTTNDDLRLNFMRETSHAILNDPALLNQARESYLLKPGVFAKDLNREILNMKSDKTYSYAKDFVNKLQRDEIMRNKIIPHLDSIITPHTDLAKQLRAQGVKTGITDAEQAALNDQNLIPSLGHMNIERQTAQDAQAQAMSFYQELEKAQPGFVAPKTLDIGSQLETNLAGGIKTTKLSELPKNFDYASASIPEIQLRNKVLQYLGEELNRNVKDLLYVPTKNLIDLVVERSHLLAGDARIALDAPEALKSGLAELNAMGSKLVYGTDIGHAFTNTPLPLDVLGRSQNFASRLADRIGLDFQQVDPSVAAQHSYSQMLNKIQDQLLKNPDKYPAWATASRLTNYLQTMIKPDMNLFISGQFNLAASRLSKVVRPLKGGMWETEIKKLMTDNPQMSRAEAKATIQKSLSTDIGPQYWTRKQVVDALTNKGGDNGLVMDKYGREVEAAGISKEAANEFYYAMQKGLRDAPTYVNGQSPFTKMLNSTFGLANVPLAIDGKRVLDLTGNIQKQLMAFRYQGSYRFAYLRAVKSALKGVTEDVPFTLDAAGALKALGSKAEAQAYALRDKYLGADPVQKEVTDYVTKEFDQNDIYNVYNPRAIEARNLYYLHNSALAEAGGDASKIDQAAVLKKFDNIYSYGNRTAAEKTVNAFFFPFSFEKTVMRQLGGHLLDNAGARLMAATAIAAYDSADGQKVKNWMETNMPLFKEVEKFNPFYHGVGIGQFGGINRLPYDVAKQAFVTMTSPQPITSKASAQAVAALIPAYRDLANIVLGIDPNGKKPTEWGGELLSTAKQGLWEIGNALHRGAQADWAVQDHLNYTAQQNAGWNLRSQLMTKVASVLEANRKGGNYAWPDSVPRVGGQKVSTSTINDLINHVYPKWDSAQILIAVANQKAAISKQREEIQSTAPAYLPFYDKLVTYSDQLQSLISKDSIDTTTLASAMDAFRKAAVELSLQDKSFAAFYKKYYQSKYGPLEGM